MLLNPTTQSYDYLDPASKELMLKTVAFFEDKGKRKLKEDDHERVWNYDFVPMTNVVEVRVSLLREKVDKDFKKKLIHTVRGAGYVLKEDG